jgi:hypothetical protein
MVVLVYQVMSVSDVSPTALMVIAPSSPIGVSHYTFRGEELGVSEVVLFRKGTHLSAGSGVS